MNDEHPSYFNMTISYGVGKFLVCSTSTRRTNAHQTEELTPSIFFHRTGSSALQGTLNWAAIRYGRLVQLFELPGNDVDTDCGY